MSEFKIDEFLLYVLRYYEIEVISHHDKVIELEKGYLIEIESERLFKLCHQGGVIAPFANVEELCYFIMQDMQDMVA